MKKTWTLVSVISACVVLAACGTSPASGELASSKGGSKVGGARAVDVPVVPCSTNFAIATQPSTVPLPSSLSVNVPGELASQLAAYSDTSGVLVMLAPRGWICNGTYGADGSGGLIIRPRSEIVPLTSWGAGWHLSRTSRTEAITATQPGGSATQALGYACSIFHAAAEGYETAFGRTCPQHPSSEHVSEVNAHVFAFEDPMGDQGLGIPSGGENPANGVDIYHPSNLPAAYIATCTMSVAQHLLCSAALENFSDRYGIKYRAVG